MQANQTDVQKILGGVQQYVIPLFQRPYSWETRQWNILWQDLLDLCDEERPRNHFIGSIVTMPSRSVPEGVSKYILIDGQQRITTLLLILAAMRDKARAKADKLADKIEDLLMKNRHQDGTDVFKLLPTQSDRAAFFATMDQQVLPSDGQVVKAFEFFTKKLRLNDTLPLETLYRVIGKSLVLVSIVLDKDDNPYLIFESLNAKGRPLSQADLIRNFFFMRIAVNRQEEMFAEYWRPMQESLGENLTEFIRHFLMRDGHIVKQGDVYFTLKESVERHPGNDGGVSYLAELARFSSYYRRLLDPESEKCTLIASRLSRLNRIEATTAYPFLLNAYEDRQGGRVTEEHLAAILDMLETFLIRRFVCGVPTNALSKIFVGLYSQASRFSSLVEGVRFVLKDREFPRDKLFRDRLVTLRLYGGGDRLPRARLILERLEQSFAHKEPISFDALNIEHVMPQTLTETWKQELGDDWEVTHEMWLHTIGNLTLTGYNPELSNADYSNKRAILQHSHVELNRYFATEERWDENAISRRADAMADLAVMVWPDFAGGERELEFEAPEEEDEQEDVQFLKAQVLELLGGEAIPAGNARHQINTLQDGRVVNIKYSRLHKSYYWFGVHASLWEACLKAGATHMVFILAQHGFVTLPVAIVNDYLKQAGTSPKADGTVRHYHVLISKEPMLELFHHGKPGRLPLTQYFSAFTSPSHTLAHTGETHG
jgi:uncharacterized protein with ParB-like and HNH nuclease domain